MKSIFRTVFLSLILLTPALASAQYMQTVNTGYSVGFVSSSGGSSSFGCANSVCSIASNILYLINSVLVPVLFAVAFLVFLYGIADAYILHPGDESAVKSGHKLILWGIIGFVVMISLWGLVNVVANTFGLTGAGAPTLPKSY